MIKEMRKVQIIGPKACLDECIRLLHALSIVHIETVISGETPLLSRLPLEKEKSAEKEFLERSAERLKNMLHLLEEPAGFLAQGFTPAEVPSMMEAVAPVEKRVKSLHARHDDLKDELAMITRYERLLRGFAPVISRLGGLRNFDIVGLTIEKTRADVPSLIGNEIRRITEGSYEIHTRDLDETTTGIVITYPRRYEAQVRSLLSGKAITELRLPDEYQEMPLLSALSAMVKRKEEIPGLLDHNDRELREISIEWYGKVKGLLETVEDSLDEIGVLLYAGQTRFAFVIEGWVPAEMAGELQERFGKLFGGKVLIRELEVREEETELIPVYIKNPRILKPFEVFLAALPPPKYGSVDPTPYVALFFPVFFGLIVGDIGYGAVIFAIAIYLRRRFKGRDVLFDIATVLSISSVYAIIFGVLFGEAFGDLGTRLGIVHPLLFHRTEALKTLLVLTIGIGVGHVLLGIIISIANHIYRHRVREAGAKIAYLTVIVSFLLILGTMGKYLPGVLFTPGLVVLLVSFVALTVLEGVLGPLEFIKSLGNMLSYVRIMAIGTASVVMALVANRIGGVSENLVVGVIAAGLIHLLNVLLSILSPSIQSMRLHYVEFFSTFYEGGGRRYTPFRKR